LKLEDTFNTHLENMKTLLNNQLFSLDYIYIFLFPEYEPFLIFKQFAQFR